jgi:hypothetical protein
MSRWWSDKKKNVDEHALAAKQQASADMRRLLESGDEEGYVALVKALKPGIKPEELVKVIELYRRHRHARALGGKTPT